MFRATAKCNVDRLKTRVSNSSTGINGVRLDHLNEDGDLSFLFYISKQCLVGNIQGKFQKEINR